MGVSNKLLRSHALRGEFITRLANDDSVNAQETMSAARHRSITASSPPIKKHPKKVNQIALVLSSKIEKLMSLKMQMLSLQCQKLMCLKMQMLSL